jgi:[ribosomal protein S5]-alanine N-acetyltransferase
MQIDRGICLVRPWCAGDEEALVRYANSREIWLNLRDQFPHPYTSVMRKHGSSLFQPIATNQLCD